MEKDHSEKVIARAFENETKDSNLILAVLAGIVAAAIGAIIWYFVTVKTGYQIGYVAIGVGYLIGFGVYLGAGRKRGQKLQIISAVLTLIAIIVAEKFIFDYFVNDYIQTNIAEFPGMVAGQHFSVSFFDADFWSSLTSPVSLLIYAVGIFLGYQFCKPRKLEEIREE